MSDKWSIGQLGLLPVPRIVRYSQARSLILEWGGSSISVSGPRAMRAQNVQWLEGLGGVWGHAPPGNFFEF